MLIIDNCAAQKIVLSKSYLEKNASVIIDRPLAITDFKGIPDLNSPETAETRSLIHVKVEKSTAISNFSEELTIKVLPYFISSSWIKMEAKRYPDPSFIAGILKHEQDHYDLAILAAFEMERAYKANRIFNTQSEFKQIDHIYDKYYKTYIAINKFYEADVDHGRDDKKQLLWNSMIKEALNEKSWDTLMKYINNSSNKNGVIVKN
jgi:hypothetical protein